MELFPYIGCTPLLTQQKRFQDRFGHSNAYLEMNPSLYISDCGNITILVRRINYRKFQDKQFILYENQSNSAYIILRGKLGDKHKPFFSENEYTSNELTCEWEANYPSYPTYWIGMEDIRFCNETDVLVTVPEKNSSGNPCIFHGTLKDSTIRSFVRCEPSNVEKNWMPYTELNGTTSVVYSVSPFQIKSVLENTIVTIPTPFEKVLETYHGSTNGIVYYEFWRLFLIHVNKERTYHRWLLYHPVKHDIRVSEPFVFFKDSYIEFPCSLCEHNGRVFISLGVNDDKAYVLEVEKKDINTSLQL